MTHLGRVVGSYDPFGDVVAILYRPPGSNPNENSVCVDGKFKLPTHFIEPKWPWPAPAYDSQAQSPKLIKQALESFLSDGWMLVVHGLSMSVPELEGSRAQRIVVLEGDPNREAFVKRWASGDKHVRFAVRSSWHSTEEEELLDNEVELEDLSGEGGVCSDRSKEEEEDKEVDKYDEVEEEGMKMPVMKRRMPTKKMWRIQMLRRVTMERGATKEMVVRAIPPPIAKGHWSEHQQRMILKMVVETTLIGRGRT